MKLFKTINLICAMGAASLLSFSVAAQGNPEAKIKAEMQKQLGERLGALALFVDHQPLEEAIKAIGRGGLVRLVLCQKMGKAPTRCRGRLEPAIAPAAVEKEVLHRRFANNRRTVKAHIGHARPCPHHAQT